MSKGNGQDVTMEELGEKERPPGEPPDARVSWAKKVMGGHGGGLQVSEDVLNEKFVSERLSLEFPME